MANISDSLGVSASGMRAQATRLRLTSENMANVDTPGYRRKMTTFEPNSGVENVNGQVTTGKVHLDRTELLKNFDPTHPLANEQGYYEGSNVNLMIEIADAREAQRGYDANLKMFEQARKMSSSLLELLKR